MTPTPDPLRRAAANLSDRRTLMDDGFWVSQKEMRALDAALAQPVPALDVTGEALHALLAPDLEIQARIEGVQAFVTYVAPGFAPGDAAYLMRAAERYSAIVSGDAA